MSSSQDLSLSPYDSKVLVLGQCEVLAESAGMEEISQREFVNREE